MLDNSDGGVDVVAEINSTTLEDPLYLCKIYVIKCHQSLSVIGITGFHLERLDPLVTRYGGDRTTSIVLR